MITFPLISPRFFNLDEFAETVEIDEVPIKVIIDNESLKDFNLNNNAEGLMENEILFHIVKSELPYTPLVGNEMEFNNAFYYVNDVKESQGMYTIILGVVRS